MLIHLTANHGRSRVCWICLLLLLLAPGCKKKPPPTPPPEVLFITVQPTNVPIYEKFIGTLQGLVDAQIRAQVNGYLISQDYKDGSLVKKGELLFEIDPRPFQAVLDQAQAKLAQDKAVLALAELNIKRYTPLAKEQAVSQETLDNAVQSQRSAIAAVQADEAAVETAQLNLGFTRISSPVDGLAGIAQAQIGDFVGPASGSLLTTVSTINPIRNFFQISERTYLELWGHLPQPGDTNKNLPLELILADGSVYPHQGWFYSIDRQVNPTTGTLQVVGLFPNPENLLRPGQFGLVRAQTRIQTNVFLVPQRAVNQLQGSYQVMLVGESNKVSIQHVQVGVQIGSDWVIQSGLKPGDHLVVEGLQQAKEGEVVRPRPFEPQTNAPQTNAPTAGAG